jgi:hypothetical protein
MWDPPNPNQRGFSGEGGHTNGAIAFVNPKYVRKNFSDKKTYLDSDLISLNSELLLQYTGTNSEFTGKEKRK